MVGQFAHISLVDTVCTPEGLDSVADLIPSVRSTLENNRPFWRLGAVSPDCPSVVGATDATGWSGVMHYVRPAEFIRSALLPDWLREIEVRDPVAQLVQFAGITVGGRQNAKSCRGVQVRHAIPLRSKLNIGEQAIMSADAVMRHVATRFIQAPVGVGIVAQHGQLIQAG